MNSPLSQIESPSESRKRQLGAIGAVAALLTIASCSSLPVIPAGSDFQGTWTQTGAGYENGSPVTWENQTLVIEKADGQGFTGFKEYTRDGEQPQKEIVNGVIGINGDVLIVDEDGKFEGRLVNGKLQGQYAEVGVDAAAINVELAKQ